jgi:hypothetical protein
VPKALAVRVRFPAWSASVRSRHLPIFLMQSEECRMKNVGRWEFHSLICTLHSTFYI